MSSNRPALVLDPDFDLSNHIKLSSSSSSDSDSEFSLDVEPMPITISRVYEELSYNIIMTDSIEWMFSQVICRYSSQRFIYFINTITNSIDFKLNFGPLTNDVLCPEPQILPHTTEMLKKYNASMDSVFFEASFYSIRPRIGYVCHFLIDRKTGCFQNLENFYIHKYYCPVRSFAISADQIIFIGSEPLPSSEIYLLTESESPLKDLVNPLFTGTI